MFAKNNYKERLRKMEQKTERFSIRKLSIGAASVLIGLSFLGFNSHTAHAASDENAEKNVSTTDSDVASVQDQVNDKGTINTVNDSELDKSTDSKQAGEVASTLDTAQSAKTESETKKQVPTTTQDGITYPLPSTPVTKEISEKMDSLITPVTPSLADLEKMGLDKDTYFESATNHTKWHIVSWIMAGDESLGKYEYHTKDGSFDDITSENSYFENNVMLYYFNDAPEGPAKDFMMNLSEATQNIYLVPIVTIDHVLYVNKGSELSFDDIKRVLSDKDKIGLVSGDWVTDKQEQGVKEVNVNEPGLQEGAVRLTYANGAKTSASINVDVVDLQGQTTYVNVNSPLPTADTVISGQPAESKDIKWVTTPDLSKVGVATGTVQVTYPDNSTGTATVTFNVENPQGKDITIHVGQDVTPGDVVVPNTYPAGSTITWVTEPKINTPGKQDVSVVVTYPNNVTSHEIPAVVTVVAPEGKDITTPNGEVPSAEKGISNVPEMPEGTKYEWQTTPDVTTPGKKPAVVVVTFPDGNKVDVPVNVTVEEPVPGNNDSTPGEPIVTPDNPVAPLPEEPSDSGNDTNGTPTDTDDETVAPHPTVTPTDDETTPSRTAEDNGETAPVHAGVISNGDNGNHASFYGHSNGNDGQKTLPQTGAQASMADLLGLMIASVGAILGLAADKKRKN